MIAPAPLPSPQPPVPFWRRIHPFVYAAMALAGVFILYQVVAGGLVILLVGLTVTPQNAETVRWATVASQILCILVPSLLLARLRYGSIRKAISFKLPGSRQLFSSVVAVFALQQVLQVYLIAQDSIPLPQEVQKVLEAIKELYEHMYLLLVTANTPWEFLIVVFSVALVPAVSEEMFFRGLVQRNIGEATGPLRAAMFTGFIFGAYHLEPMNLVPLVILGAYFGYLVYRSGGIIVAISAHFFNNFIACAASYMHMKDDFIALAPSGPVTLPLLLTNAVLFTAVFIGATLLFNSVSREQE